MTEVPVFETTSLCAWPLVLPEKLQHDFVSSQPVKHGMFESLTSRFEQELLLQERYGCWCSVLVPILLWLEHDLVSAMLIPNSRVMTRRLTLTLIISVFEYTYLLFWNIFWTLLPVIALGLFDRDIGE